MRVCPGCESRLEDGYVELKEKLLDTLAYGLSYLILVFNGRGLGELDVLKPAERLRAGLCSRCGVIVISQEPWIA
jgi:hypothetical protein